jgi:WD40 repeat protein
MKYKVDFLVLIFFIVVTQYCHAMTDESTLQLRRQVTTLEFYKGIDFLSRDKVVVTNQHGCSLMDVAKNEEIKRVSNVPCNYVKVDQSNQKIVFSYGNTIKIYNVATDRYEWERKKELLIKSFYVGLGNIFLHLYDDNTNNSIITKFIYGSERYRDKEIIRFPDKNCVFHPKQPIICSFKDGKILVHDVSNIQQEPIEINVGHAIDSCQISTGYFMAVKNMFGDKISIINLNNKKDVRVLVGGEELFFDMLFYGKGLVLFTRSKLKVNKNVHIIRYWDITLGEIIDISLLQNSNPIKKCSFFPDGKKIAFMFDQECIFYPVPDEVTVLF